MIDNQKFSKLCSLFGLKHFHTLNYISLDIDEVSGLNGLVGSKSLILRGCGRLSKLASLIELQCLRKLVIFGLRITEMPKLNGLEQFKVINAPGSVVFEKYWSILIHSWVECSRGDPSLSAF